MVSLRIAVRYLFSKKSNNAVNVISVISMAGVAVATAAIICVLSVFNGFSDLAYKNLSLIDPELKITSVRGKVIEHADSLSDSIAKIPGVAMALPTLTEQTLAIYGDRQTPVMIKGVPPRFSEMVNVRNSIIDGQWTLQDSLSFTGCTVMSVGTAITLGARPGYDALLALYVPRRVGRISQANPMASFRSDSLWVSGVFEVTQGDYDNSLVFVPLSHARMLLDYTTQASAIEIKVDSTYSIEQLKNSLYSLLGPDYKVANRIEQQQNSFRMIKIEKWISFLMLAFILIIASFNVVSTLSMLIIEKRDNMATLRALGAAPRQISGIFFCEGWLISLVGGIIGILLGIILVLAQQWGGFIKLSANPDQLAVTEYPVRLGAGDILSTMALIIVVGLVIGFIAARASNSKN